MTVRVVSAEEIQADPLWKSLTESYGLVKPLDWTSSKVRQKYLPTLTIINSKQDTECDNIKSFSVLNPSDVHEMAENVFLSSNADIFFQNSASVSEADSVSIQEIQTADEVIEELNEIISDDDRIAGSSSSSEDNEDIYNISNYCLNLSSTASFINQDTETLKAMSLHQLNETIEKLKEQTQALSSQLLVDLDLRDDYMQENEVKNDVIGLILEVQNKQKRFMEQKLSKKHALLEGNSKSSDLQYEPGHFLLTTIPCGNGAASKTTDFYVLMNVLKAISNDSHLVPSLLTSYILKVLVPASSHSQNS